MIQIMRPNRVLLQRLLLLCFSLLTIRFAPAQKVDLFPPTGKHRPDSKETLRAAPAVTAYMQPSFTFYLGSSAELFAPSGTAAFGIEKSFSGQIQPFLAAAFGYTYAPVKAETSASIMDMAIVGGANFWLHPRVGLRVCAAGGYWHGFLNDEGGGSGQFSARAGAGVQYLFSPGLSLGLDVRYSNHLGLYQGVELAATSAFTLSGREGRTRTIQRAKQLRLLEQGPRAPEKGRGIEPTNLELCEIFPVFHKFYDDHPVGLVTLVNKEATAVTDIELSFLIKQYMDSPKKCPAPAELAEGERQDVPIMSLLTERVLAVTEATKVAADLTLDYRIAGESYRDTRTFTVRILDRNAMSWDDDRKAAAFVTAKDPAVLTFAKGVTGPLRDRGPEILGCNFPAALGLFTALDLCGFSYVVDPQTPFAEYYDNTSRVDYLQFPRQTLQYQGGDCDDLSILCAALLEAVGIETAFITVPGHIYIAFALDLSSADAVRCFASGADLIERGGKIWVPVEVTERRGGFLKAWTKGAREWREAQAEGVAGFFPVHDAWREYEPVGLPGSADNIEIPRGEDLLSAFQREMERLIEREIEPREARLKDEMRARGDSPHLRNKLGILFARYGRYAQAEAEFGRVLARQEYLPALINMGNLFALQDQAEKAEEFYSRAIRKDPQNPQAFLGLARVYHASEQHGLARQNYEKLENLNPGLARRFAYLGSAAREQGSTRAGLTDSEHRSMVWAQ